VPATETPSFYGKGLSYLGDVQLPGKFIVIEGSDCSGRSTQTEMLKEWLEASGHAVLNVGLRRSDLVMDAIIEAKKGNLLGKTTLSLLYATDLADQLENRIIPAMRAGFVAIADRYIYTLMARDLIRGADEEWLEKLFGFTLVPDLIFFLDAKPEVLLHRAFAKYGQLDYWESGMDLHMGGDMIESFLRYQSELRSHYKQLAAKYHFHMVDASPEPFSLQKKIRKRVDELVAPAKPKGKSAKTSS
jgi:dTMP kinase